MTTYEDFWGILWRMKAELLPTFLGEVHYETKTSGEEVGAFIAIWLSKTKGPCKDKAKTIPITSKQKKLLNL